MISFVSLFVGFVVGIVHVQLMASTEVVRVELFLDGQVVAELREPFSRPVDLGCEPAPLLLGFVLGPLLEENLRRAMILSRGDPTTFVTRPISAILLLIALAVLVVVFLPSVKAKREEVFQEED